MWACIRGHSETALVLYRWNHTALNVRNRAAQTALDCASIQNHSALVLEIRRLETKREITECGSAPTFSGQINSVRTDSGASNFSNGVSPATSISSLSSVSSNRIHDGVFLRPGAVTR